jgi:hypothetical protein
MTLRLIDLEAPLDDVEFPNGAKHQPVPFGAAEYRLWRDIQTEPDAESRGMMLMQIVRACYPTAAPDDLESCTPKMLIALAAHAGRKIDQVRDALKNVGAGEAVTTEPPPGEVRVEVALRSSPKTSGATSSRKSRARSGKTGGASTTASPTGDPSTSGTVFITSTTPGVSTSYVESSTTSTAPS